MIAAMFIYYFDDGRICIKTYDFDIVLFEKIAL